MNYGIKCLDSYAPNEIRFNQCHIMWILNHLDFLKTGYWPCDPDDINTQQCFQGRAYFETAILVAAEVEARLATIGDDGFIIKDRYHKEEQEWTLSKKYHLPQGEVRMRIRRGLRYMAGDSRKSIPYDEWVKNGWKEKRLTPSK